MGWWHVEQQRLLNAKENDVVALVADSEQCVILNVTERSNSDNTSLGVLERLLNPSALGSPKDEEVPGVREVPLPFSSPTDGETAGAGQGTSSKGSGFGHASDSKQRDAIDNRAMEVVRADFEKLQWEVRDVSSPPGLGHDLSVTTSMGKVLHVEVKGTRTKTATGVHVTGTQIKVAQDDPACAVLAIVEGITVEERDGVLVGTGGNAPCYVNPWDPKDSEITIQKALYRLPNSVCATAEELDH